jgi:DivIVA domain-containing protein
VATLFLAYAVADRERALALIAGLRSAGHTPRFDPHLAGDAGWWAGILSAIQDADAFLYAAPPTPALASETSGGAASGGAVSGGPTPGGAVSGGAVSGGAVPGAAMSAGSKSVGSGDDGAANSRWAPPVGAAGGVAGARFAGEPVSIVVAREREYAEALGLPTLEINLSGAGTATGIDFREPGADAAFRLIGAIDALPSRPSAMGWQPAPEPPFAAFADLVRDVPTAPLTPSGQRALADRLRVAATDPAARELAAILRRRSDLDAETARRLDETFPPAAPADQQPEKGAGATAPEVGSGAAAPRAGTGAAAPRVGMGAAFAARRVGTEAAGSRVETAKVASSKWAPRGHLTVDDVRRIRFRKPPLGRRGYDEDSVDKFLDDVESDLRARQAGGQLVRVALITADISEMAFPRPPFGRRGYDEEEVDQFLDEIQRTFTALDRDLTARGAQVAKA